MNGSALLMSCILLTTAASYFLKLGAMARPEGSGLLALVLHPYTVLGGSCYAATFMLYAVALQKVPLSLAQPVITGGASVVTALVSIWVLKETMGAFNWLGLALVCLGIYLLFIGKT